MYDYDDYCGEPFTCWDCGEEVGDNAVSSTINEEANRCSCWQCYMKEQIEYAKEGHLNKTGHPLFWKEKIEYMDDETIRLTVGIKWDGIEIDRVPGECWESGNLEPYRFAFDPYYSDSIWWLSEDSWLHHMIDEVGELCDLTLIHNYGNYKEYKLSATRDCLN